MEPIIEVRHLTHTYSVGTPFQRDAVHDVSFTVEKGEFLGIIGHTGSGKSTLIQHLNGLLAPTSGEILLSGRNIWAEPKKIRSVRFRVGLVFQYPEYQLFEETVYKDIAFGPSNMGKTGAELDRCVRESAKLVGLGEDTLEKSPFELSGGQKRRVALAGVMAMRPEVLILDEPTAGLDPGERVRFRNLLSEFAQDRIVLISTHIVSDVEYIAAENAVMKDGKIIAVDTTEGLVQQIEGKVWQGSAPAGELPRWEHRLQVVNLRNEPDGTVTLRYLAEAPQLPGSIPARPKLEDLYLWLFPEETEAVQ